MVLRQISITFMSGPRDGDIQTFEIDFERLSPPLVITIGRREDMDIQLHFDSQASRLHAHLGYDGTSFWLEDVESRNGVYLQDDQRIIERTAIDPGALFRVGKTWLRLDPLPSDITSPADPVLPLPHANEMDESKDDDED